ncbi:hypothetical protein [Deinococcus sp.]|uniref:hypothetical protein n=1 Tax=Deinococcus sp. TaxID=47478 RepID=UPI003CC5D630
MNNKIKSVLMMAAVVTSGMAFATKSTEDTGEAHATVTVKATVENACKFLAGSTTIDAGIYSANTVADTTKTGSLGFICNAETEYEFYFTKTDDTFVVDKMNSALNYKLEITGPGSNDVAFGDDAAANEGIATGLNQAVTFKLTIPAGQYTVPSAGYSANLDVEVDY